MRNLLITLRYRGTKYHGFQVQQNAVSICSVFQDAVQAVFAKRLDVKGCSRTDAGVHANKYCLSMLCETTIRCDRIVIALNQNLSSDIAVISVEEMPLDFHARYDCTGKQYLYKLLNSHIKDPFSPELSYRLGYTLDVDMLNKQAQDFVGTHDFISFCSSVGTLTDTTRTIFSCNVTKQGDYIIFEIAGDGFLYNMVRIIVGTLVFIGQGKIEKGSVPQILAAKNRMLAGKTMPACGLYLNDVYYDVRR